MQGRWMWKVKNKLHHHKISFKVHKFCHRSQIIYMHTIYNTNFLKQKDTCIPVEDEMCTMTSARAKEDACLRMRKDLVHREEKASAVNCNLLFITCLFAPIIVFIPFINQLYPRLYVLLNHTCKHTFKHIVGVYVWNVKKTYHTRYSRQWAARQ